MCDSASSVSEGNEGKQNGVDRRSTHQIRTKNFARRGSSTSIAKHRIRLREAWGYTFGKREKKPRDLPTLEANDVDPVPIVFVVAEVCPGGEGRPEEALVG